MQESPAQIATTTVETTTPLPKQRRGFAMMDPDTLRAVCSQGGQTAHALGRAHRFNAEKASQAGKKGGATVSAEPFPHGRDRQPRRQSQEGLPRATSRTTPSRGRASTERVIPIGMPIAKHRSPSTID
jgi:general stress protein YciG